MIDIKFNKLNRDHRLTSYIIIRKNLFLIRKAEDM